MSEPSRHVVAAGPLREFMKSMYTAAGCEDESAGLAAGVLWEAELRGYATHGLIRLPNMIHRIQSEMINTRPRIRIVREQEGSALVDADRALGPVGALYGAELAIRKAKRAGCCAVGVWNGNHICMAGYYAERIARAGCVGIVTTVTAPLAHVLGGMERLLGTNPLAIAVPSGGENPILVDFATTAISFGTVLKSRARGERIPEGVALGPDGQPTTDPSEAARGALTPFAEHKGFGLSLVLGLLAGPLLGAKVGKDLGRSIAEKNHYDKGDLLIAIDPSSFGDPAAFGEAVAAHLLEVKSSPLAPGYSGIRIPGERSFRERERRLREGVPIEEAVWRDAVSLAGELGVQAPA
ncbi:MAG: Ldh family oxidoreductase [Nitrospinota bacterium]